MKDWMKIAVKNYEKMHKDDPLPKYGCHNCDVYHDICLGDEKLIIWTCRLAELDENNVCEDWVEHVITICDYCNNECKFGNNQCEHYTPNKVEDH